MHVIALFPDEFWQGTVKDGDAPEEGKLFTITMSPSNDEANAILWKILGKTYNINYEELDKSTRQHYFGTLIVTSEDKIWRLRDAWPQNMSFFEGDNDYTRTDVDWRFSRCELQIGSNS